MGLMDKFKNLFTDEEIDEEEENEATIEIKEIKKEEEEHKLPTFMREKIEREKQEQEAQVAKKLELSSHEEPIRIKELKVEEKLEDVGRDFSSRKEEKEETEKQNFKFPIDINDNDFIETRSRQSIHKDRVGAPSRVKVETEVRKEVSVKKDLKVSELYKDKKEDKKKEERHFKATPIISPIYGILDQNYTSGDMESNKGENLEHHRHSKNVDFDSVRKKAYGSLTEEIKENLMCENCEYLKEAKECKKEKERARESYSAQYQDDYCDYKVSDTKDYSYDEKKCNYDNITLDEATENYYDYGVEYDKMNYRPNEEEDVKIVNHEDLEHHHKKEIPPVKSSINLLSTLKKSMNDGVNDSVEEKPKTEEKNLELTDDLFNLIDSMYDERNDSND